MYTTPTWKFLSLSNYWWPAKTHEIYIIQLLRFNEYYQTKDQNVPDSSTSGSAIVIISGSIEDLGKIDIAS